jgi:hypothetical protein
MQFKQLLHRLTPVFLALFFIWPACQKTDLSNAELADHEAEFAFPLFNTTLLMKDLMLKVLNDTLSGDTIVVNSDGTMTLYYTGDVAEKPATDIFASFTGGFFPLFDTIGTSPIDMLEGVTIYRADLKKGRIQITAFNSKPDTLTCKLRIPQMSKDGEMFAYYFTLLPTSTHYSPPIDVSGYVLESDSNTLEFIYEAYKPNGERVKIEPGVLISFETLEFSYLEGYWGYQRYPLIRDTIEIDINQTDLKGDVTVKNPKVTMRISNSWGFPTRGVVKYLSFIGQNGEEIPLVSSIFVDSAVDFNYPKFALNEIGQTKYTDLFLDETNSNIADIFNAQPTRLIYEVDGISNAEQDPDIIGFLTDSSIISLKMQVELVLEGSARNFGAEQMLDLNFGDFGDIDTTNIQEVEFKLVTENGTPIASELQLYFLDDAGAALDSLFSDGSRFIMEAAPVNGDGVATGVTRTENFIQMPIERFNRIRTAKKAFLKTAFTTAEGGSIPVKLLADDRATVKMGMKVKTKY